MKRIGSDLSDILLIYTSFDVYFQGQYIKLDCRLYTAYARHEIQVQTAELARWAENINKD